MARRSAFQGTWQPNRRPFLTLTADSYVSIQGETSVIACGECRRKVNVNKYLTSVSTEASVDSPPGSATVQLSVPDNDVSDFYSDGELIIISMMEIEIFSKGYYLIGGLPQYYRVFWGIISSVQKSWSNGVTTISITCKDILRWWEITNVNKNPAFLMSEGSSSGNWLLFQDAFAGMNPYTTIISLAKDSMGDFSVTTGSFLSYKPEDGPEKTAVKEYAKDIMAYWQLKFGNMWNRLVLYGTSGQAYTFSGFPGTVSPLAMSRQIFESEKKTLAENPATALFKIQPHEVATFKRDYTRAGDLDFFQSEVETKLSIALMARDQIGYEFYCDTTGDIVFKPPFYNLNVLPNKPVSWIQDFEILEDNTVDSEQEVYTHVTGSGNAFGGVNDYGLNDEITTPRTGVVDWHLLRRYGWRRLDFQCEWAGNPKKLFYFLMDYMDRVNSKRHNGTITIPMRPELRMGFPVWIPRHDSFFYIQGISHNFSPGGQATTTLTLTAKRSKFVAPKNIGLMEKKGSKVTKFKNPSTNQDGFANEPTFNISFPDDIGQTSGTVSVKAGSPAPGAQALRDPRTGKLLGFPNAVMVYRTALSGAMLSRMLQEKGSKQASKPAGQDKQSPYGRQSMYQYAVQDTFFQLQTQLRSRLIERIRSHRYEAGMTNGGAYDYAHDASKFVKEFVVVSADSVTWGAGSKSPDDPSNLDAIKEIQERLSTAKKSRDEAQKKFTEKDKAWKTALSNGNQAVKKNGSMSDAQSSIISQAKADRDAAAAELFVTNEEVVGLSQSGFRKIPASGVMIRPVSDEFGFEVVGHFRYGRSAFIDRGKVQVQTDTGTANKINIQFSAVGGLLTDVQKTDGGGLQGQNFAQAFEQMQPDDYVTGASFKGVSSKAGGIDSSSVNPTGQADYTDSINHSVADTGKAVFAEADALRRATTLAELQPTLQSGLDEAFNNCSCSVGRADWLSMLPRSAIKEVLSGSELSGGAEGFFDVLSDYMSKRFGEEYKFNLEREQFAMSGSRNVEPDNGLSEDNGILPDPTGSLFKRAALGDPGALEALQNGANFNWGMTNQALDKFSESTTAAEAAFSAQTNAIKAKWDATKGGFVNPDGSPTQVGFNGSPPPQQVQPPAPTMNDLLNPSRTSPNEVFPKS